MSSPRMLNPSTKDFVLILLSLVLPFITVGIKKNFCSWAFVLSLILTVAFHLPAIVYAIYIVLANPEPRPIRRDIERCPYPHYGSSGQGNAPGAGSQFPAQAPIVPPSAPAAASKPASGPQPSSSQPPQYQEHESQGYASFDNKVQRS